MALWSLFFPSVNVAKAETSFLDKALTEAKYSCPQASCSASDSGAVINVPGAKLKNFKYGVSCKIDTTCFINSLINSASDTISQASAKTKEAGGINAAASRQDINKFVEQKIETSCQSAIVDLKRENFSFSAPAGATLEDVDLSLSGDVRQHCAVEAINSIYSKMNQRTESETINDPIKSISTLVVVFVVLLILLVFLFKRRSSSQMSAYPQFAYPGYR